MITILLEKIIAMLTSNFSDIATITSLSGKKEQLQVQIGNIKIGANAPISVQSMTNTDTRDVKSTLKQINNMAEQGCELVRLAILNPDAAEAIKEIKKQLKELKPKKTKED